MIVPTEADWEVLSAKLLTDKAAETKSYEEMTPYLLDSIKCLNHALQLIFAANPAEEK
jgi:hypothetical protein